MIPAGFSWTFVIIIDVTMAAIGLIATLQRPMSDWPVALAAIVVAFMPWVLFFVFNICKYEGQALWAAWMAGTAVLLFATSTPVRGDFAPLLLTLTVGVVGAITSMLGGFLAAATAAALQIGAAAAHRLDTPELYLAFLGIGWLVGYLVHVQRQLLISQQRTQAELAAHAAADKEGRDLREGEVVTACQSACPTRAIVFGDINDPASEVSRLRRDGRHYTLLEELGTRPRTTYLARWNDKPDEERHT